MRIIASLPDLSAAEIGSSNEDVGVEPAAPTAPSARRTAPAGAASRGPRNRPDAGRFPGGSIVVLTGIAAACWAAAWWSDGTHETSGQAAPGRQDVNRAGDVPDRTDRTETASP